MNIKFEIDHDRCGDCRVCCRVLPFTDEAQWADKYQEVPRFKEKYDIIYTTGQACTKICSTGCSIQTDKPKICQEFWCDYLTYELPEKYYPHNCGFVSYIYNDSELWIVLDELPDETGDYPNKGCKILQPYGCFYHFESLSKITDGLVFYEIIRYAWMVKEKINKPDMPALLLTRFESSLMVGNDRNNSIMI